MLAFSPYGSQDREEKARKLKYKGRRRKKGDNNLLTCFRHVMGSRDRDRITGGRGHLKWGFIIGIQHAKRVGMKRQDAPED